MRYGLDDKLWVVVDPTPQSTLGDILFQASLRDLSLQFKGGLSVDENPRHCDEFIPGVGTIHTHWWITATPDPRLLHIRVRSEGVGSLAGPRSRAEFTTFRSCTNSDPATGGCPTAP